MNPKVETTNTVSPTIADTLSEAEEQQLRQSVHQDDVQHDIKDYYVETQNTKDNDIVKRLQQSTVVRHIIAHPLQSLGLALIGGILIGSVYKRR